jgi:hypothetical protein
VTAPPYKEMDHYQSKFQRALKPLAIEEALRKELHNLGETISELLNFLQPRRLMVKRIGLFKLIVVCCAYVANATTLQVGNGQTYTAIGDAIAVASAGDTINVHSGIYQETVASKDNLIIQANAGDSPIIQGRINVVHNGVTITGFEITGWTDANNGGINLNSSMGGTISNNIIHDGGFRTKHGIYCNGCANTLIQGNIIYSCHNSGIVIAQGHSTDATYEHGIRIINNYIHDNAVDGIDIHGEYFTISGNQIYDNISANWKATHPDGIQFIKSHVGSYYNANRARVYNNKIRNSTQLIYVECGTDIKYCPDDVSIYNNVLWNDNAFVNGVDMTALATQGIVGSATTGLWVYSNTLGNFGGRPISIGSCTAGGLHAKNNIVYNNLGSMAAEYKESCAAISGGEIDYNIYFSTGPGTRMVWTGGSGAFYNSFSAYRAAHPRMDVHSAWQKPNINAFPTPAPQKGSPAIDTGIALGSPYNADILGASRPYGAGYDIGAYEYQGSLSSKGKQRGRLK